MAKLTDEIKEAIVARIAQFEGYASVAREIGEAFGIDLTRFQVRAYDASAFGFAAGDRWRQKFWKFRNAYLADVSAVPIAHAAFRLNQLQGLFLAAKAGGNLVMALQILRQAAEEAARHEARKPTEAAFEQSFDSEQRREMLRELFDRGLARLRVLSADQSSASSQ